MPRLSALLISAFIAANGVAAESRFFTTSDGVRLHYLEEGAGETLVFVPGWLMPAEIWGHQIGHFAQRYRVIAFDPRSQGDSQIAPSGNGIRRRAEDLHDLVTHLGSERVVLIGWSLGVMESLLYVHVRGEGRLAGLVLVDNSVGENPPQSGGRTIQGRPPSERALEMADFVRVIHKSPQTPEYFAGLTDKALRTPPGIARSLLAIPYPRSFWRTAVHGTQKPLLYAVTAGLRGQAESLARRRKGATTAAVFPVAGHALFVDEPGHFNALLDAFLVTVSWQ